MNIRKADVWDVEKVVGLWLKMHKEIDPSEEIFLEHNNPKNAFLKFVVRSESPDWGIFVIEENNKIVGFIMSQIRLPEYNQCHRIGFVESLYVLPEHRGDGTYKELIDKSIEWAKSNDAFIYEFASAAKDKYLRFYKGLGFEPVYIVYRKKEAK